MSTKSWITGAAVLASLATAAPAQAGQIVRFATSLGTIDVELTSNAPQEQTVTNFLKYVDRGDYNGSIIHRSRPGFIVQGGGWTVRNNDAQAFTNTFPAIPLQTGLPNLRGTLAMARTSDPNSATSEWFFNLVDNRSTLDATGPGTGYAVFGQIVGSGGLQTIDAIAGLPTTTTDTFPGDSGGQGQQPIPTLPVLNWDTQTKPPVTASNYVYVNSVFRVAADSQPPVITVRTPAPLGHYVQGQVVGSNFSCDDGQGTGVKTCEGPDVVDTSSLGKQTFKVTAADNATPTNSTAQIVSYYVDPPSSAPPPTPPAVAPAGPATSTPPLTSPFPVSVPTATLSGPPTISKQGVVTLRLRCSASRACSGKAALLTTRKRSIGASRFTVLAGRTATLKLHLTATGKRQLRVAHGRLRTYLQVTPTGGKPAAPMALTLRIASTKK